MECQKTTSLSVQKKSRFNRVIVRRKRCGEILGVKWLKFLVHTDLRKRGF